MAHRYCLRGVNRPLCWNVCVLKKHLFMCYFVCIIVPSQEKVIFFAILLPIIAYFAIFFLMNGNFTYFLKEPENISTYNF